MEKVDVILTSFARFDLLRKTIESFLRFNSYDINRFMVLDDKGELNMNEEERELFFQLKRDFRGVIKFWHNTSRCGQIRTLDMLWGSTTTDYVFCMEDDWEFYRERFIEDSLAYLEEHPFCIQLWLRELNDTNSHPVEQIGDTMRLKIGHKEIWNGFSFNPGLKRRCDYDLIGSYGQNATFVPERPWESEISIGKKYRQLGYWAGIGPQGYVRHIGNARGIRS